MSAFVVAIGGEADIVCCAPYVFLTQSGHAFHIAESFMTSL